MVCLKPKDRKDTESLTGRMPFLLNLLLKIKAPDHLKEVSQTSDLYYEAVQYLNNKLWTTPEVRDIIRHIIDFAEALKKDFTGSGIVWNK